MGGGAASLASMVIHLKVMLVPPLVEDNVAGLKKAPRWAMDKAISLCTASQ